MSSTADKMRKTMKLMESSINEQDSSYHGTPRENISKDTELVHQAVVSVIEELEAMDWYRQRADDCESQELREILLHNMREEIEHASMLLEWLRRNDKDFNKTFGKYLNSEGSIIKD